MNEILKKHLYYEEPGIIIYNADCRDILPHLEKVDLVVTSPPYDGLRDYGGYEFNFEEIAKGLREVMKEGGVIVWVVGDQVIDGSESGTSFKQALYFKEIGFKLHDTMIYEKNGSPYPEQTRYYQSFEYMFIFSNGVPKTTNLLKDRKNIWDGSWGKRSIRQKNGELKKFDYIHCEEFGVRFNIWRFSNGFGRTTKDKFAYIHPAMFPELLANDHILSWSNSNDIILDPMCGSGTILKMAKLLNRRAIGIEIEEKYCAIAVKRLQQEVFSFQEKCNLPAGEDFK